MDNNIESTQSEVAVDAAEAPKSEMVFEFQGREFDLATPEGRMAHRAYLDAFSTVVGKVSNENGRLKSELAPFAKLGAKVETVDDASVASKVKQLTDEGKIEEAFGFMFGQMRNMRQQLEQDKREEQFWSTVKTSNRELFESIPDDVAKHYVFSTQRDALYASENPLEFVNSLLREKFKVATRQAKSAAQDITPVLGQGKAAMPKPKMPEASSKAQQEKAEALFRKAMGL